MQGVPPPACFRVIPEIVAGFFLRGSVSLWLGVSVANDAFCRRDTETRRRSAPCSVDTAKPWA